MGRYAQRRISGGGTRAEDLNYMTAASKTGAAQGEFFYANDITKTGFDPGDFISRPSGNTSTTYVNDPTTGIIVNFSGSLTGDDHVDYVGNKGGVLSPQTIEWL